MVASFPVHLRVGTRGSPLALAQTTFFIEKLKEKFPVYAETGAVEVIKIKASGDYDPTKGGETHLRDCGGKGLFTRELEEALLEKRIDIAVHSMKDVPTWMPVGLEIAAVLPRGEVRDAFLGKTVSTLAGLPAGSRIGTSSLRRSAQLLNWRRDLVIAPFRGNVDTRLKKLAAGEVDGIILAACGLERLGLSAHINELIEPTQMLPAAAQGIIGIQTRQNEPDLAAVLKTVSCAATFARLQAERAMLEVLDGTCSTPIGALARLNGENLSLEGLVAHPEGKDVWRADIKGGANDARNLGQELGRTLRRLVPPGILPEG